ncbi:MAG: hypothetical protein IJO62_04640 [Clostridia bacterium]|nr:hypothetical protein [Clostridia bacterium]
MKTLRRILAFLMSLTILLSVCACDFGSDKDKDQETSSTTSTGGGYSSSTESDYDSTVSDWETDQTEDNNFNNGTGSDTAVTPGSNTQQTVVNVTRPATPEEEEANKPVRGSVLASGREFSKLTKESDFQYVYKGKNYAYGISNDNKEYIAFRDEFGDMIDVFNGAGRINITSLTTGGSVLVSGALTDWREDMLDSWPCIIAHYELTTSGATNEFLEVTYIFKDNGIDVKMRIRLNSNTHLDNSTVNRTFLTQPLTSTARVNETWHYPDSGDQPYTKFDSLVMKNQISKDIYAYTFVRSENSHTTFSVESYDGKKIPINILPYKYDYFGNVEQDLISGVNCEVAYTISFVDTSVENNQSADYLGLFKSWDSQFAAGVALVDMPDDNSTIVVGNSTKLNLNVTNLIEEDLKFSLRYDVRDHYGNVVDAGVFIDNTVYKYADANRTITVGGKYGMYYLNLYVISEHSTYREMFPFALLPDYEYKYWETNPFGINSVYCNDNNQNEWIEAARLQIKVGTACYRIGASTTAFWLGEEMARLANVRWVGSCNDSIDNIIGEPEKIPAYVENITTKFTKLVETLGEENFEAVEFGNEFNLQCLQEGGPSEEAMYPIWHKYLFEPTYNAFTSKYPNIRYLPTPDSACSPNWLKQFVNGYLNEEGKVVGKVWEMVDIVDTHIYGPPQMPDTYGQYRPEWGAGLWQIESGMQRMDTNLRALNPTNPTRTDFMLTEVGYQAVPWNPTGVDYRTQADYLVRIGAICLGYGADMVQYYNMFDRVSYSSGSFDNREWYFGQFNEHDYYGIIKPKTAGIAFAIMTRQLESYKKNSAYIDPNYDQGWSVGGVRAFSLDTDLHGKVVVAWSNQEVLPNGKKNSSGGVSERNPTLPWESQWAETDPTKFYTKKGGTLKVVDSMGNATNYVDDDNNGEVIIPLSGSPVYIYGVSDE